MILLEASVGTELQPINLFIYFSARTIAIPLQWVYQNKSSDVKYLNLKQEDKQNFREHSVNLKYC